MPRLLAWRQAKTSDVLVFKPSFLDIIASQQNDIKEAKERVSIKNGKYIYSPSSAYKHYIARFAKKR